MYFYIHCDEYEAYQHHGIVYYVLINSQSTASNNEKKFKKLIMRLSNPQDALPTA